MVFNFFHNNLPQTQCLRTPIGYFSLIAQKSGCAWQSQNSESYKGKIKLLAIGLQCFWDHWSVGRIQSLEVVDSCSCFLMALNQEPSHPRDHLITTWIPPWLNSRGFGLEVSVTCPLPLAGEDSLLLGVTWLDQAHPNNLYVLKARQWEWEW